MSNEDAFLSAHAEYVRYADYAEPGKSHRAAMFATAARRLLAFPEQMTHAEESFRLNHGEIRQQLQRAEKISQQNQRRTKGGSRFGALKYCGD